MKARFFSKKVVRWYQNHHRVLPWRESGHPYHVWLSEVILQQTRVNQGLPYYEKFLQRFPTVQSLASASIDEVLRMWQGLGYYTRARNLHRAAQIIALEKQGHFPTTSAEWEKLPGIGPYTAAAIASISSGEAVPVIDGNVFRVLSRVFGIAEDPQSGSGKKIFKEWATSLMPDTDPGTYNQAVMEFGALQCTPGRPNCDECPLQTECVANRDDLQTQLPLKKKKKSLRTRYFTYVLFHHGRKMQMRKREGRDIWHGLYEPPMLETKKALTPREAIAKLFGEKRQATSLLVTRHTHLLSHQKLVITIIGWVSNQPDATDAWRKISAGARFYSPEKLNELPKPVVIAQDFRERQLVE